MKGTKAMLTKAAQLIASALVAAIFSGSGASAVSPKSPQRACNGVDTSLFAARKQEYAELVVKAITVKIKASSVTIHDFMADDAWSAVYASTPVSEDGVFFFQNVGHQKQFKDVWGGWAEPSDTPDLIKWARNLGAPASLAACFAAVVTRH